MANYDTLKFSTEQITDISKATLGHQQQWDAIWTKVRTHLSAVAAEALSKEPGGSLDNRTAQYHRKTQQYNEQLQTQAGAVGKVGNTATDYNTQMTRVVAGHGD